MTAAAIGARAAEEEAIVEEEVARTGIGGKLVLLAAANGGKAVSESRAGGKEESGIWTLEGCGREEEGRETSRSSSSS